MNTKKPHQALPTPDRASETKTQQKLASTSIIAGRGAGIKEESMKIKISQEWLQTSGNLDELVSSLLAQAEGSDGRA